jgi:hypothetical protein
MEPIPTPTPVPMPVPMPLPEALDPNRPSLKARRPVRSVPVRSAPGQRIPDGPDDEEGWNNWIAAYAEATSVLAGRTATPGSVFMKRGRRRRFVARHPTSSCRLMPGVDTSGRTLVWFAGHILPAYRNDAKAS